MYKFAILIGIYSYAIFLLGVLGELKRPELLILTLVFAILSLVLVKVPKNIIGKILKRNLGLGKIEKIVLLLIAVQVAVNFIGVLGPELSFDALWYHLTLPKIYLASGEILHIPGGLLYYSDMPKLVEMLYIASLSQGSEIIAKALHFLFGLGSLIALYALSKKFLSTRLSLFVVLVFYSNLVIGWLSITSYIDLGRVFFEILTLYYFSEYIKKGKISILYISAVLLGLAISTKLIAVSSLLIYIPLILLYKKDIKGSILFTLISLLVPAPWFIFSYINTGNPIYPFLTNIYQVSPSFNLGNVINFIRSSDPISPIYLIFLPLLVYNFKKINSIYKLFAYYSLLAFIIWLVTPQSGGGRFIAAYLPAFSLAIVLAVSKSNKKYQFLFYVFAVIVCVVSIGYRGVANLKYIPVILGAQTKSEFLSKNLNFDYGDFYDVDGYFEKKFNKGDRVLVYGIHNLYYVNFPYIHESYLKKGDFYNYVLVRGDVPQIVMGQKPIYTNERTHVKLYRVQ